MFVVQAKIISGGNLFVRLRYFFRGILSASSARANGTKSCRLQGATESAPGSVYRQKASCENSCPRCFRVLGRDGKVPGAAKIERNVVQGDKQNGEREIP